MNGQRAATDQQIAEIAGKPMTTKKDLLDLAGAVEKLDGPCRETDVKVAVAVDWRWPDWEEGESTARGQAERHGIDWLTERATTGWNSTWRGIPRYTGSLDAAMTLVPEGYDWAVFRTNGGLTVHAWCGNRDDVFATTPALALTAASLRAIAEQMGEG